MPDTFVFHPAAAVDAPAPSTPAATPGFADDIHRMLAHQPRTIAPKYFYDAAGSALFDRICTLPEYYPTRTELGILGHNAAAIAHELGPDIDLVEFGAGSLTKVRLLLDGLDAPRRFVPIDISGEHLEAASARLRNDYPGLEVAPLVADYTQAFALPQAVGRRVGFFPGSTLGNFAPAEAARFLAHAATLLRGGGLLLGVDLVKDPAILHAAYNDREGVTAAFNRNLLHRANAELGTDFAPDAFHHHAFYNAPHRRIEMHLVSRRDQRVHLGDSSFTIGEGETIHTESSHKFTVASLRDLASCAGFAPAAVWTDPDHLFSLHWLLAPG